jgi:hypothetical protein
MWRLQRWSSQCSSLDPGDSAYRLRQQRYATSFGRLVLSIVREALRCRTMANCCCVSLAGRALVSNKLVPLGDGDCRGYGGEDADRVITGKRNGTFLAADAPVTSATIVLPSCSGAPVSSPSKPTLRTLIFLPMTPAGTLKSIARRASRRWAWLLPSPGADLNPSLNCCPQPLNLALVSLL